MCRILIFTIFASPFLQLVNSQYNQTAFLFSEVNFQGSSQLIEAYISDLIPLNFNDRAKSVCIVGIWIFYDQPNYNPVDGITEFAFGPGPIGRCFNFNEISTKTSSLSYVGSVTDYRNDTLTLFEGTYFQGVDQRTSVDLPILKLDEKTVSIILTGRSPWTIFEGQNFTGIATCLHPPSSNDWAPSFIYDTEIINVPQRSVRSVRKGCFDDLGGASIVT